MTKAVVVALEERLDRLKRESKEDFAERVLAIGRDYAAHMTDEERSLNPDDLLYDERGLPHDC